MDPPPTCAGRGHRGTHTWMSLPSVEYIDTVKAFDETLYKLHARHAPGPHYYVAIVSTLPKNQGQGHYSELMRELIMTLNCAAHLDGLPCYLECTR